MRAGGVPAGVADRVDAALVVAAWAGLGGVDAGEPGVIELQPTAKRTALFKMNKLAAFVERGEALTQARLRPKVLTAVGSSLGAGNALSCSMALGCVLLPRVTPSALAPCRI